MGSSKSDAIHTERMGYLKTLRLLSAMPDSAMVNADVMKLKGAKCLINLSNAIYAITDGKGDVHPITNQVQQEAMKVWLFNRH